VASKTISKTALVYDVTTRLRHYYYVTSQLVPVYIDILYRRRKNQQMTQV